MRLLIEGLLQVAHCRRSSGRSRSSRCHNSANNVPCNRFSDPRNQFSCATHSEHHCLSEPRLAGQRSS